MCVFYKFFIKGRPRTYFDAVAAAAAAAQELSVAF